MKINPRVIIVREAISRLVPILVGKGVKVTQAGSKAYVQWRTDGTAGRVNLPYLPDDADDELITAVMGFLDHEVGHILFTDPKASLEAAKHKFHDKIWNPIEDTFIERKMGQRYTGSAYNMRAACKLYLTDRVEKGLKEHPEATLNLLLVPAIRAWAGQDQFVDFMSDKWHLIEDFTKTVGADMIAKMPKIESSWDSFEIAKEIYKRLKEADEPKEKEEKAPSKGAPPPEEEEGDMRDEGTPMSDDDMDWDDDEPGSGGGGGEDEEDAGEPGEDSDDAESGASSSDDGEEPDSSESGPAVGGSAKDDEEDGEDEHSDDSATGGEKLDGEDVSDDADAADSPGGSPSSGGEDKRDSDETENSADDKDDGMGAGEFEKLLKDSEDFDDEVAEVISKRMGECDSPYLIYTKDHDKVVTIEDEGCPAHYVKALEDKVDHMIAPMQKDLERAIAARSAAVWTGGHKSGRLHGSALVRLFGMGDRVDVFRRKQENTSKSVAVSLVVDCSGSMSMGGKISLACHAAYGLSATLERIGITHEVIGFTTAAMPYAAMVEMRADPNYNKFARDQALVLPVFKEYHERLTANVVRRFALVANQHQSFSLQENVDGESIQIAAHRLAVRTEKRKIMIVLSDGEPACQGPGAYGILDAHLKESVKNVEKTGIDVVGIGIMSSAVKKFYPKNVVLRDIKELPVEVLRQLKGLLLK